LEVALTWYEKAAKIGDKPSPDDISEFKKRVGFCQKFLILRDTMYPEKVLQSKSNKKKDSVTWTPEDELKKVIEHEYEKANKGEFAQKDVSSLHQQSLKYVG
jgi:hypothetical protein